MIQIRHTTRNMFRGKVYSILEHGNRTLPSIDDGDDRFPPPWWLAQFGLCLPARKRSTGRVSRNPRFWRPIIIIIIIIKAAGNPPKMLEARTTEILIK